MDGDSIPKSGAAGKALPRPDVCLSGTWERANWNLYKTCHRYISNDGEGRAIVLRPVDPGED